MATQADFIDRLKSLGACDGSIEWLEDNNFGTLAEAWAACTHPDWMTWLIFRLSEKNSPERKNLVKLLIELVSMCFPDDQLLRSFTQLVEKWCDDSRHAEVITEIHGVIRRYWMTETVSNIKSVLSKVENLLNTRAVCSEDVDSPVRELSVIEELASCVIEPSNSLAHDVGYLCMRFSGMTSKERTKEIILKHYPTPPELS